MKKLLFLLVLASGSLVLVKCGTSKKAAAANSGPSYGKEVMAVVQANCTPCHVPDKGGRKKAYDNYENVKADIDDIIRRIELEPGQRGFMPFKKEQKIDQASIDVFKKWKEMGMPQ